MARESSHRDASPREGRTARRPRKKERAPKKDTRRKVGLFGRWYVIVPVAFVVLAVFASFWFYPAARIAYHQARNERVLGAKLKAVNAYNAQLEQEIKSLETTQGVAEYARKELNLVDKGDHVVIVTRDGKPIAPSEETSRFAALIESNAVKKPFGAWTNFLDRIFGAE